MTTRLRSFPTHRNSTGWQAQSQFLQACLPSFVDSIRRAPGDVWKTLEGLSLPATAAATFDRARQEGGGFALPEDVLFPTDPFALKLTFGCHAADHTVSLDLADEESLRSFRSAISGDWRGSAPGDEDFEYAQQLIDAGVLSSASSPSIDWSQPGVYRLPHASLLFRSEQATILTDPVFAGEWLWAGVLPRIDAILISHAHGDHFSLASLMQFPRDTRIVVPQCDGPSMLGDDLETLLGLAGFTNVVAAPWYSTLDVGGVAVGVYPFYGEQPWVGFGSPCERLRNSGNTYVVDQDGHLSWILIDAGQEFGRSMTTVAREVRRDYGQLDFVFSNLRTFPWHPGQIDGSGRFLFCFPLEQLENPAVWPEGVKITLGPEGVADVLSETGARYFLPYAHWWHAPNTGPLLIDGHWPETDMVSEINSSAQERGLPLATECLNWLIGQRATLAGDALEITPFV